MKSFTELDAILKEASIVSFPFNKLNPLALKLITLTALLSIFQWPNAKVSKRQTTSRKQFHVEKGKPFFLKKIQ